MVSLTSVLTAAAALSFPSGAVGMSRTKTEINSRSLADSSFHDHFTVVFDECVGLFESDCIALIQNHVASNPAIFDGLPELNIETKHIREDADENYYLLGLRTDVTETQVVGILGDGMIFYPFQWCLAVDNCIDIGPWDCDVGEPLTVEQCCNYIKGSMPTADMNENYIDCYVDPPVGSTSNPPDYSRVQLHVDKFNRVKHVPRNE